MASQSRRERAGSGRAGFFVWVATGKLESFGQSEEEEGKSKSYAHCVGKAMIRIFKVLKNFEVNIIQYSEQGPRQVESRGDLGPPQRDCPSPW